MNGATGQGYGRRRDALLLEKFGDADGAARVHVGFVDAPVGGTTADGDDRLGFAAETLNVVFAIDAMTIFFTDFTHDAAFSQHH